MTSPSRRRARCECGAPIEWAIFGRSERRVPLDLAVGPWPAFNLLETEPGVYRVYTRAEAEQAVGEPAELLRRAHFATCPPQEDLPL